MTICVGILTADDAAVIASDSMRSHYTAAESGNLFPTVTTTPMQKVSTTGPDTLCASTGQAGMVQRATEHIAGIRAVPQFLECGRWAIARLISQSVVRDLDSTLAPKGRLGSIVLFPSEGQAQVATFTTDAFQPGFLSSSEWFNSCGSGQALADGFLAFLRRAVLQNRQPALLEALLIAGWTVQHVLSESPAFCGGPLQLGILRRVDGVFAAKLFSPKEIETVVRQVKRAETRIGRLFRPPTLKKRRTGRNSLPTR